LLRLYTFITPHSRSVLLLFGHSIAERRTTFVKSYGIKIGAIKKELRNITKTWRTRRESEERHWELGKMRKTSPPHPNPTGKKLRHLEHMQSFPLAVQNFPSQNSLLPFLA
jgi:hypothetical protein